MMTETEKLRELLGDEWIKTLVMDGLETRKEIRKNRNWMICNVIVLVGTIAWIWIMLS